MRPIRALVVTIAVLGGVVALGVPTATAGVPPTCATAQSHLASLQARLATMQQRIDARNAKLADAGDDPARIAEFEARVTRARHHYDRLEFRLTAITERCPSAS